MKFLPLSVLVLSLISLTACATYTPEQKKQITLHVAVGSKCTTGEHVLAHVNESPKDGWKAIKEYQCTMFCGVSQLDKSIDGGKVYSRADLEALDAGSEYDKFLAWPYVKPCK